MAFFRKKIILPLLGICFSCLLVINSASAVELTVNKIVAVVNGEMVTLHDIQGYTARELSRMNISFNDPRAETVMRQVLESRINDILLRQEATRYKISVDDNEVSNELRRIREGNKLTQAQFEAQLKRQGNDLASFKEQIKDSILRQKIISFMISRKVVVTKEEIENYYNSHKDEFASGKEASFSVIVFPPKSDSKNIYEKLKSGAIGFEDTAKKYSVDPSASAGGLVKKVPWGALSPNMKQLLESLKPGQISDPIPFQGAVAVVRLNNISSGESTTLKDVYEEVEKKLKDPRLQERFKEYTDQLRQKAVVDIRL